MRCFLPCLLFLGSSCSDDHSEAIPPETLAQPQVTIGGTETGPESFSDIRAIAVDGTGRLYVVEGEDREIRMFDSTGRFLRALGRRGQGPGEFTRPHGVAIGPGGRIYAYDPRARRVTVFDTSGLVLATHFVPIASFGYFWEGGIDSAGRLVDHQTVRLDTITIETVRRMDFRSGRTDSLPLPDCGFERPPMFRYPRGVLSVPFGTGRYTWIDARGATWCAHTSRPVAYRVPFGASQPSDSFVSVANPAQVSATERSSAIARVTAFQERAGEATINLEQIPAIKPVLEGLDHDERDRLWMRVADSRGTVIHVFEPSGRWVARVRLPLTPKPTHHMAIRANALYVVTVDSLDVPAITRLTVTLPRLR